MSIYYSNLIFYIKENNFDVMWCQYIVSKIKLNKGYYTGTTHTSFIKLVCVVNIYRSRRFIVSRAWGGVQTHSYGGPIFEIFFLPERYRKMMMHHCFLFSIFWFFKAVGPKWVFQSFLWLDRKYSPIFTFDMSLQRYWIADFRIFENFEKS